MVLYFLRWTMRTFFESIPNEPRSTSSSAVWQITCVAINTSNEAKCPLLSEFWIYSFSRRMFERVFVRSIVNIRPGIIVFFLGSLGMNQSATETIAWEPLRGSMQFVCPTLWFIPHEPRIKNTHSLINVVKRSDYYIQVWFHPVFISFKRNLSLIIRLLSVTMQCMRCCYIT